jgi:hypothetical protein
MSGVIAVKRPVFYRTAERSGYQKTREKYSARSNTAIRPKPTSK